jgi:hypothetical protein
MAALVELGHQWPCQTQGHEIDLETVEPHAGEILECYFECDRVITNKEAVDAVFKVMEIKEQYPDSVLHYVKVEPRRITIQYSVAPYGGHASPLAWWGIAIALTLLIAAVIIVVHLVLTGRLFAPPPPSGHLSVSAAGCSDELCTSPEALDVTFSVAGKTYRTKGGTVLIEDLPIGPYDIIPGDPPEGYQPADLITVSITKDQTTQIRLKYFAVGVTPPQVAWLVIDTSPIKGPVFVDEGKIGQAPVEVTISPLITYVVSFGDVEDYATPSSQSLSLQRGEKRAVNGVYVKVGWPEWAKWLAIGGGTAVGIFVVGKTVELVLARRKS